MSIPESAATERSPGTIRVLSVIPSLAARNGGPGINLVDSIPRLRLAGVAVSVYATDIAHPASTKPFRRATVSDFPTGTDSIDLRVFPTRHPYRVDFSPALARELSRQLASFDLVRIHGVYLFPHLAAYRYARRQGVPYVVSTHGSLDPYIRQRGKVRKAITDLTWQKRMLQGAAAIHVTTETEGERLGNIAPGVPRIVVPNGLETRRFSTPDGGAIFRQRFVDGHLGPLVVCIGRVSHVKNIDTLIRAVALAQQRVPGLRLAVVGPDDEGLVASLRALAGRERVAVTFTGPLYGADRLGALAAADVWALASHSENFGLAVAEALAAGRAVVISRGVNLSAEVERAGAGRVAEPDPQSFAHHLVDLLRDRAKTEALALSARELSEHYDWAAVVPAMRRMFERVAGHRPSEY